jgi:hypothetical protein
MNCDLCANERTVTLTAATPGSSGVVERVFDCPACADPQRLTELAAEIDRYVAIKRSPNVVVMRISA